jgi:hypothetical protein
VLTPEAARERLAEQRIAGLAARRKRAAARLPQPMRGIGAWLLAERPTAVPDAAARTFDAVSAGQRGALFSALFPQLGQHLETLWQLGKSQPYQSGWQRRAFRAPDTPQLTLVPRLRRLRMLVAALRDYDPDPVWVARWAGYLPLGNQLGALLAAVIDGGGEDGAAVFDVLVATANGEEPIGIMGRHVTGGLLGASRQDGWEAVERLLSAAQRQEGLRQVILESADVAHPQAFRRMTALILDQGMARFSSVARAIDVWLALDVPAGAVRTLDGLLERAVTYLDDAEVREKAITSGQGEDAYLALWAAAYGNAPAAVASAVALLDDPDAERRFAAVHLLAEVAIVDGHRALVRCLGDDDLRVVRRVLQAFSTADRTLWWPDLTSQLKALLERLGTRPCQLEPLLWPWTGGALTPADVASALVAHSAKEPVEDLMPYLALMNAQTRGSVARRVADAQPTAALRPFVLTLIGDSSSSVRAHALRAAAKVPLHKDQAPELERLLRRKAGDMRRGVEALLLNQPDEAVLASADRLLAGDTQQRLAGFELLRRLSESGRAQSAVRERTQSEAAAAESDAEQHQLQAVLSHAAVDIANLDARLGLVDEHALTPVTPPRARAAQLMSRPACAALSSLDAAIHAHREHRVTVEAWDGPHEQLLGNLRALPSPFASLPRPTAERPPLWEVWSDWDAQRPSTTQDPDGFELARAAAVLMRSQYAYLPTAPEPGLLAITGTTEPPTLHYTGIVVGVLDWLLALQPPPGIAAFLLDAAESLLSQVPKSQLREPAAKNRAISPSWRDRGWLPYLTLIRRLAHYAPGLFSSDQARRWWQLECWVSSPTIEHKGLASRLLRRQPLMVGRPVGTTQRPPLEVVVAAHNAGVASDDDLLDHLLGGRAPGERWSPRFRDLHRLSGRGTDRRAAPADARISEVVARIRRRVVEVELQRGEAPTPASRAALTLACSGGLETLAPVLARLGGQSFLRGWSYDGESATSVFSHLVRASAPGDADTPELFAQTVRAAGIPEKRLIELAAFAPQWASRVERTIDWPGLASAVWWLHAHTKDSSWSVDKEIRDAWAAEVSERTPLSGADLLDGAVDVEWFQSAYERLGAKRWQIVNNAAKYCSTGGGHKRAQLYADAMLGVVDEVALRRRIQEKRHQDAVRAVGLVPLPKRDEAATAVLARYGLLQLFLRESKKFGSQRQLSEKRAVEIGLANLARTAGYRDPLRLSWAVEAQTVADLAGESQTETIEGVTFALRIDELGAPELVVTHDGKALKAVPAKLRSRAEVKALRAGAAELRRQGSRVGSSLEQAMIRGDAFTGQELHDLSRHHILFPKLSRLVLLGDGIAGYPGSEGRTLLDYDGVEHAVGHTEELRIAHALDLLEGRQWHEWQRDCLTRGIVQPFKQVFRELYVPTRDELGVASRRYAGHQIQVRQALALLGRRGWAVHPEQGIRKTFHNEHVIATLWFLNAAFTPGDVEPLTVEEVRFLSQDEMRPVQVGDLPGRLFSEVMRDLDLVVSVAHAGGVDPETSASTVEMRAALVEETAKLLGHENVRLDQPWVLIDGHLGDWSVHLGSANVHRRPGGAVCIVPVHGQQRGRLFLPFADDDPKTAEVLAKVLLLARDDEIRDPTILEQLT